jgi:hypothetical protein
MDLHDVAMIAYICKNNPGPIDHKVFQSYCVSFATQCHIPKEFIVGALISSCNGCASSLSGAGKTSERLRQ